MKINLLYMTLWSLTNAAYINRMATVNRIRGPTPLRPGLILGRPWAPPRYIQAASHRSPYVIYRNLPHRYAMKHISPGITRSFFSSPWKTTPRLVPIPIPAATVTSDHEFVRAAPPPHVTRTDGAIHTIPAPNLSLSEKPIVVVDNTDNVNSNTAIEETKPVYEVTEKYSEPPAYSVTPKIEPPVGFSKPNSYKLPDLQNDAPNNPVLQQVIDEYGLSTLTAPHASIIPQQFSFQGYNRIPSHQDLLHTGSEAIIISPNALYQPDPMYLQKLQNHLLQHFPAVEFIPYQAGPPFQPQNQPQTQPQTQASEQNDLFLLENEQFIKQPPSSFVTSNPEIHKNLVQRETQEATVLTLTPQGFSVNNATPNYLNVTTTTQPPNVTQLVTSEVTQAPTTITKQVIEPSTENLRTTPIYYAQVGQSVANVIANGFYSAINDVRAANAMAQIETINNINDLPKAQPFNTTTTSTTTTTTTLQPDLQAYFIQNPDKNDNNKTGELKPLLGAPFEKPVESVNVAYTILRAEKDEQTTTKDGVVYAGQLVEATISEDQDFNKEKADILARRPPSRVTPTNDKKTETPQKITVVKAKIPPKSKLTFDDKTGEPVLRIYASYLDSPGQRERLTNKLANMKHEPPRKQDLTATKSADKTQGSEKNQVSQFGLKLRSRSDDYIPVFDEY